MDQTTQSTTKKPTILEELGLSNLPSEEKESLVEDMTETIMQRVFERVLPQLSAADNQALDKLAEGDNADETVVEYLAVKVPGFEKIVNEETEKYAQEVKNELSEEKTSLSAPA